MNLLPSGSANQYQLETDQKRTIGRIPVEVWQHLLSWLGFLELRVAQKTCLFLTRAIRTDELNGLARAARSPKTVLQWFTECREDLDLQKKKPDGLTWFQPYRHRKLTEDSDPDTSYVYGYDSEDWAFFQNGTFEYSMIKENRNGKCISIEFEQGLYFLAPGGIDELRSRFPKLLSSDSLRLKGIIPHGKYLVLIISFRSSSDQQLKVEDSEFDLNHHGSVEIRLRSLDKATGTVEGQKVKETIQPSESSHWLQ